MRGGFRREGRKTKYLERETELSRPGQGLLERLVCVLVARLERIAEKKSRS
jgi:hypothetical protein